MHEGGDESLSNQTALDVTLIREDNDDSSEQNEYMSNYDKHIHNLPKVSRMVRQNAFLVGEDKIVVYSKYSTLWKLDNQSPLRFNIVWFISQKWFDYFILSLIFINSLLMGFKDYLDRENKTPFN